uniref:transcription factor bHLH123-like n=1 Tax=Erigeron canadensis TaxID=72917 RepID=UPI001CB99F7A|nr:transcription factor bHLH123-like [Erigeron canadensis]
MADSWWDSRTRPAALDTVSVTSMNLFQETTESTTTTSTTSGGGGGVLGNNPSLHNMMELGLSSQPISQALDWNQALYRGDQRNDLNQSGYQALIQEDQSLSSNTSNYQETTQWKSHKMYPADSSSEFKQINVRGFHLDERVPYNEENGLNPSFQTMDHSYGSNSTLIQSLFGSDHNTNQQQDSGYDQNQGMSNYSYQSSYGGISMSSGGGVGGDYPPPPPPQEFSVNSPSKVQPPNIATPLQFSNNARFWNASATSMNDVRSTSFFPLQMQSPSSTIEDKPKNPTPEMVKKSNSKSSTTKRPRNENPPLPAFKVRKEKMGDRITALQQLVSPFGKTDTASVLSEAIEYIKFLHEQVNVLSTPYMKNGAAIMQQQQQVISDKTSDGSRQDLRSRGLCLVPVSSTFPVTHETTVDFWTPSFGGTFR